MVSTKENSIPTYVRAGAFILMARSMQSTEEYTGNDLVLHYFNDSDVIESEREYYNDDGKTPKAFEKGMYELMEFEAELEKDILEIDFEAEYGKNWDPTTKEAMRNMHQSLKRLLWHLEMQAIQWTM